MVTKQEEIKVGIGEIELNVDDLCGVLEGHVHLTPQGREKVLQYLHSQGVVIKVSEEEIEVVDSFGATYKTTSVAVEPLINEQAAGSAA